jgi:putative addiction module antidote
MAMQTKIRKIGNSLGIVLPKEAVNAMKVKEGEIVYLTESPEHSLQITPGRPGFKEKSDIVASLMHRYRNALQELAR